MDLTVGDFAAQTALTLIEGRAMAEALMVDTCEVTRLSGTPDPLTGVAARVVIYSGKGKRQTYEAHEMNPQSGGHTYVVQRYKDHFPVGSFVPNVGDVVEWTASAHDPDLVGVKDRIVARFNKTSSTSMRVDVDEIVEA